MEYFINSAINQTWKLCIFAGFLTLFLLALISSTSPTFIIPKFIPSKSSMDIGTFISSSDEPIATNSTTAPPPISTGVETQSDHSTNSTRGSDVFQPIFNLTSVKAEPPVATPVAVNDSSGGVRKGEKCKMYEGKWIYRPEENPRYKVNACPFLEEEISCQQNGRPDLDYEGWGWEANDCKIPLFNGRKMMKKLRGKRVIIAGDSLNRNMWESLACLLYTSISPRRSHVDVRGSAYKFFKAKDYNFTLEFYWAPFLVNLDQTHNNGRKVLVLDEIVSSALRWKGADVMVFNTGHWWRHYGKTKVWDLFQYKGKQVEEMKIELAYERALSTWAHWIRKNVDPTKTRVFFRSVSPEHMSKQWCLNASRPILDESYIQLYPRSMTEVVERKIREMKDQVTYLNITKLSSYRRDAHPSIYRFQNWRTISEGEYKRICDCSHWCLPGLPDTWNRILYASLLFDHLSPGNLTDSS